MPAPPEELKNILASGGAGMGLPGHQATSPGMRGNVQR